MTIHPAVVAWLAHAAVGGSVFLAAGCLAVALCRQPVRCIRLIELTLAGALLAPFASSLPWLPHWSTGWLAPEAPAVDAMSAAQEPAPALDMTPAPIQALPQRAAAEVSRPERVSAIPPAPGARPLKDAKPVPAEPSRAQAKRYSVTQLVLLAYAIAAGALLVRLVVGLLRLGWVWRGSSPAPAKALALLRAIAGPEADRVRLRASDHIELPLMFAAGRPVILLPGSLCRSGDEAALRFCLAHEWSHVERQDARRWYLAGLVQFVFFWQPLFWWLRRRLRLCQDYLADARAAAAAEAEDYADFLVGLARRRLARPTLALGIGDRHSNLYRRIVMLLHPRQPLERRCLAAWSAGAVLVALALLVGVSAVRLDAGAPGDPPAAKETPKKDAEKGETLNYSGRVFDKDTGKPIAGAVVTVRRSLYGDPEIKEDDRIMQETKHTTNAEGKYSFVIPPEQSSKRYCYIELDVEHPDYAPRKHFGYALGMIRKNEKMGGRPFFENVDLRPGKPITGTIQTADGKPAAGVKVLAYSVTTKKTPGEFEYGSFADGRSDAKGQFRVVLTTPGQAVFWILPEAYAPSAHAVMNDKRGDLGTFTLQDGIRMKGKVLDTKGKPVAGVNVNAEKMDRSEELQGLPVADSINRSAVSDARGGFALNPLPPGNYQLKVDEFPRDGTLDKHVKRPVPEVFLPQKVTLKAGEVPDALEVRAAPSVVIEAQYYDSKGKTTRGHSPHIFGQIDKHFWFAEAKADANGKVTVRVPHGLEQVRLQLSTNEHGSLRWRKAKGEPLNNNHEVDLGTVNDDVKGIEIVRYVAPIVIAKVSAKDGGKLPDVKVTAMYGTGKGPFQGRLIVGDGLNSDVSFEHQEDGRFRSEQLLPDEEVTFVAHAKGYKGIPVTLKMPEGESKDIELILEAVKQ
jgi:beta-lactamase regulating signal transducer with metallopeptidase domain/protocatechuate 3,4-dioxygenase beta subunit